MFKSRNFSVFFSIIIRPSASNVRRDLKNSQKLKTAWPANDFFRSVFAVGGLAVTDFLFSFPFSLDVEACGLARIIGRGSGLFVLFDSSAAFCAIFS